MNKFVRGLITEWRKLGLPTGDASVVVAVSGGADSTALLAAMADLRERGKLDLRLIAAHLDHGLRGAASTADRQFVEEISARLGVEIAAESIEIGRRGNLEQNARDARYAFFGCVARRFGSELVLTGHTMSDQAETFLLNLIRGSGPDGLSAMRTVRLLQQSDGSNIPDDRVQIARPLLRWAKREDTEQFCREMSISYRTDEMNEDTGFSRVKVRKTVIPLLEEFNPRIIDTLCTTARRVLEMRPPTPVEGFRDTLPVSEVAALPQAEMFRVLRSWLAFKRGTLRGIDAKHIEAIERLVLSRKSGKTVELPGRQTVSKHRGSLVFQAIMVDK